jgi:hypothetical protein
MRVDRWKHDRRYWRDPRKPCMMVRPNYAYTASIMIVSFNTRELLRECLDSLIAECGRLGEGRNAEILVVDNSSRDGSADMVERDYGQAPITVRLFRSTVNLGFGAANNVAMDAADGHYIVLLNSDAFLHQGALNKAIDQIEKQPKAGVGGARLVCGDGSWQPSARGFHTLWRDALVMTGLADRFPKSRIFGAPSRTWADPAKAAQVDWVTGAFMILRREALAVTGIFDPAFFLYCEEVDLCRRIQQAGFEVWYWPDVFVTHLGGESSKQVSEQHFSNVNAQIELWRIRSWLLYYRKHHGRKAWMALWLERSFFWLRRQRNRMSSIPWRKARAAEADLVLELLRKAWQDTDGGRTSPPRPW